VVLVTTWTGQAQLLADDIREPGFTIAAINASAWCARVDPEATHGLVGAALALTSGDAGKALWSAADPCPADGALLTAAAELEGTVAQLLEWARQMIAGCRADFDAAIGEARAARALLASALTEDARAEAEARLSEAMAVIADCEAALEILDETGTRLAHALNCLRKVPDDMASTYEVPYELVHDGGQLPHNGEFLTGGVSYEAA
jgi:hypothetical protein